MPIPIKRMFATLGVRDLDGARLKFLKHLDKTAQTARDERSQELLAYVSDNRWVADCPDCAGGIAADPTIPEGWCFDCAGVFSITAPGDYEEAEFVLRHRPARNRHWSPLTETVLDLRLENAVNGFITPGSVEVIEANLHKIKMLPQPDLTRVEQLAQATHRLKTGELVSGTEAAELEGGPPRLPTTPGSE